MSHRFHALLAFALMALAVTLAAPFPLPTVDGKPPAVAKDQKVFKVPVGFARHA